MWCYMYNVKKKKLTKKKCKTVYYTIIIKVLFQKTVYM